MRQGKAYSWGGGMESNVVKNTGGVLKMKNMILIFYLELLNGYLTAVL